MELYLNKTNLPVDTAAWKKKATAFVTRSHRHLWGKNNEDPLAVLFTRGLKNDFCKQHYLGWNKFAQHRPSQNWGLSIEPGQPEKLFLPSGIVIPFIVDKNLCSVFIQSFDEKSSEQPTLLPGSSSPTLILGKISKTIVILEDLFDGLFLYQQAGQTCSVFIHPDSSLPFNLPHQIMIKQASKIYIFSKPNENMSDENQLIEKMNIPDLPENTYEFFKSKQDLINRLLS